MTDITQHNHEIHENLAHWNRKPLLREAYAGFYRAIAAQLGGLPPGQVVECGAGVGNLKATLPHCLATDLFPNPWLDRVENVYALSFRDGTVAAVILFDVFHHLQFPGTALAEIRRTLVPGGRVVIFEPAMGLLGWVILGCFHHEPLGLKHQITWDAPADFAPERQHYYAAQGNAWRVFVRGEHRAKLQGWQIHRVHFLPAVSYLLSGGFRGPTLLPRWALPVARCADRMVSLAAKSFASRMLVVLEKT